MKVRVRPERCQGHNRCTALCPEVFVADDFGYSSARVDDVPHDLKERVRAAAANCPERAITIEDGLARDGPARDYGTRPAHSDAP